MKRIHPSADVASDVQIGEGTSIWNWVQIRSGARIGVECIIGKGVSIDAGVVIGNRVKIQNNVSIYHGVVIADGVFVGPHVCFTNDLSPRAINPDGTLKSSADWQVTATHIRKGAALGANSVIRCGVTIGEWAMVGAGSVVTKSLRDQALAYGNPAVQRGWVCPCGARISPDAAGNARCSSCGTVSSNLRT